MTQKAKEMHPEVFISHRHDDEEIAKTVFDFIETVAAGKVNVFCASDIRGKGLRLGEPLTKELAKALKECCVVLLIYTRPDADWSYCMWEAGVALDPEKAQDHDQIGATKIIALQFTSRPKGPLGNDVYVDAKSVADVKQFVKQLLTDDKFFPGYGEKISHHSANGKTVQDLGKKLYDDLEKYQPSMESKEEWKPWPHMTLEIDFKHEDKVKGEADVAKEIVLTKVFVRGSDDEAIRLFSVYVTQDRSLGDLFVEWKKANPHSDDKWMNHLVAQIICAINARDYTENWELLYSIRRTGAFVPIVLSCSRLPNEKKLCIRVCFIGLNETLEVAATDNKREKAPGIEKRHASAKAGLDYQEPVTESLLLWVEGSHFSMGSNEVEVEANATPCHGVQISSFWLGQTPVTRHQYHKYLEETGDNKPRYWQEERFSEPLQPVVGITWDEAMSFCNWLSEKTGLDVRLPTEAQWEFAARGPMENKFPWGGAEPDESRACYGRDEQNGRPCPVGRFKDGKGPFGTLDQSGNVWEWCRDKWDERAYEKRGDNTTDPLVEDISTDWRAVRGGGWDLTGERTKYLNPAYRMGNKRTKEHWAHGFRIAIIPKES